jgi:hypothetical protein
MLILFRPFEESGKIIAACFEVYKEKGCGCIDSVFPGRVGSNGLNSY